MPGSGGTIAQRASIAIGVFYLFSGVTGLVVNPDFGTGSGTSAEQFLIDWNGWHAVLTLLLVPIALAAALRPMWAVGFHAYNAVANSTVAVWALFDKTPLGILDLPNVATDFVLHLVVAAVSFVVLLIQLRRDRAAAPRAAVG
jgi:hypothetical protein